ncbi:MAG: hypothetical protein QM733_11690 [Ilumatobacteraceae bacterium]
MYRKAMRPRLRAICALVAVTGTLALAACGSDEASSTTSAAVTTVAPATTATSATGDATTTSKAGDEPTTTVASSTPSAGFQPVTISHLYGSTEIKQRPERIVSLDTQWTDVLIALDTAPVGYLGDPNVPDGFPWRGDMLATSTRIDATNALPFEQIAALEARSHRHHVPGTGRERLREAVRHRPDDRHARRRGGRSVA